MLAFSTLQRIHSRIVYPAGRKIDRGFLAHPFSEEEVYQCVHLSTIWTTWISLIKQP